MDVVLTDGRVRFGDRFHLSFHRTLRLPDDGRVYPLPPGLGLFPVHPEPPPRDGPGLQLIIPIYQREALWLGFSGAAWKPTAVKVIVGGINAVSGLPDEGPTLGEPQDYLVCPDQPWLDGFNVGEGVIRQFVAMPLGLGYAVEAGAGLPEQGGLDILVFDPKPGRFPDTPPPERPDIARPMRSARPPEAHEMAIGASGRMHQKIYKDKHGREVWDPASLGKVHVRMLNTHAWREATNSEPPPTPIDVAAYTAAGLPWFAYYDETRASVSPEGPTRLKTVGERDRELQADSHDRSVDISERQIIVIEPREQQKS
jgi:hypothetical protein